MSVCTHMGQIKNVKPNTNGCEECLKMGDTWVHLRLCLELRACWLLRFFEEQTCYEALSCREAPDYEID